MAGDAHPIYKTGRRNNNLTEDCYPRLLKNLK